jgi:hypothetical protein
MSKHITDMLCKHCHLRKWAHGINSEIAIAGHCNNFQYDNLEWLEQKAEAVGLI